MALACSPLHPGRANLEMRRSGVVFLEERRRVASGAAIRMYFFSSLETEQLAWTSTRVTWNALG